MRCRTFYSLVIEATAAAGGVAILGDAFCEVAVQHVSHGARNPFPGQNEDDDDSVGTVMASALSHQAQQFLLLAATTDHLTGSAARQIFNFYF